MFGKNFEKTIEQIRKFKNYFFSSCLFEPSPSPPLLTTCGYTAGGADQLSRNFKIKYLKIYIFYLHNFSRHSEHFHPFHGPMSCCEQNNRNKILVSKFISISKLGPGFKKFFIMKKINTHYFSGHSQQQTAKATSQDLGPRS